MAINQDDGRRPIQAVYIIDSTFREVGGGDENTLFLWSSGNCTYETLHLVAPNVVAQGIPLGLD